MIRVTKSSSRGVTRAKIGNILKDFKTYLLGTISSQFDTLKTKKKQEDEKLFDQFSILNVK